MRQGKEKGLNTEADWKVGPNHFHVHLSLHLIYDHPMLNYADTLHIHWLIFYPRWIFCFHNVILTCPHVKYVKLHFIRHSQHQNNINAHCTKTACHTILYYTRYTVHTSFPYRVWGKNKSPPPVPNSTYTAALHSCTV